LHCFTPLDVAVWLPDDCILVTNPAIPAQKIAV